MERARQTVFIFMCVLFCEQKRVFGTDVDVKVKAGENITLYCDCVMNLGSQIVWMRNCSHEYQPPLAVDPLNLFRGMFPRFNFVLNSSSNSYDLHIENVSVSDEGIYYCVERKPKVVDMEKGITRELEHEYGSKTTRLSVLEPVSPCVELFNITSTSPASDCLFCWNLLFSVSSVCVLLFSICVYCLCQKKSKVPVGSGSENRHVESGDEVCYASLDMPSIQQKRPRKKRVQSSDFSVYSDVRTSRM